MSTVLAILVWNAAIASLLLFAATRALGWLLDGSETAAAPVSIPVEANRIPRQR